MNASRPLKKSHKRTHKCMGGFASEYWGTHFQVGLGMLKSPQPKAAMWHSLTKMFV